MVDGNIILSVAKAMELLQILSQAGKPLLLKELTALCGYPKSTVFGLLTTMRAYDVVTQTPDGRYTLGLRLFEYGRQVERSWDISTVARPYMEHLCRQTGASVMLSVCEGGSVITLDQVETRGSLRVVSDTGSRLPLPISLRCCGRWRRAAPTATPSKTASTRSACAPSPHRSTTWRVWCSTRWA